MDSLEQDHANVSAYRMAGVDEREKQYLLNKYKLEGTDWLIPSLYFNVGAIVGVGVALYYSPLMFKSIGLFISLFCVGQLASRSGHMEGFYQGLKWGKRSGVCQAMGIPEDEIEERMKAARDLIVDHKTSHKTGKTKWRKMQFILALGSCGHTLNLDMPPMFS